MHPRSAVRPLRPGPPAGSACRTVSHAGDFRPEDSGVTSTYMQPAGTVVAFGAAPTHDVSRLDATALACDILRFGDDLFTRIKQAEGGSLLLLLAEAADDPALAAVSKASRTLRMRGGGEAVVVLPAVAALPGPQARGRLQRAAQLTGACVVQPVAGASWADAVRCFVEPLAVWCLRVPRWTRAPARWPPSSSILRRGESPNWRAHSPAGE